MPRGLAVPYNPCLQNRVSGNKACWKLPQPAKSHPNTSKSGGVLKMAKKQSAAMPVNDGLFFPEDFSKLHRRHVIYIKQGVIIDLDKL